MIRNRGAFVARTSAGKMDMDFGEIRSAFVGAETVITKLNEFRHERTARLIGGETIVPVTGPAMLAIHILPLQSFTPAFQCDLTRVSRDSTGSDLVIPRHAMWGWLPRFTHQGFVQACTGGRTTGLSTIYANVFRNGAIEVVDCDVTTSRGSKTVAGVAVEWALLEMVTNLLRALKRLEMPPPFYIFPTLLNIRDYKLLKIGYRGDADEERPLSAEHLVLPEAIIEDYECANIEQLFRPAFDVLWNAAGWAGSPIYDRDGNYVHRWRENLRK